MIGFFVYEVGVGYCYLNELMYEMCYYIVISSGQLLFGLSFYDCDMCFGIEVYVWYLDDKIDIGNWIIMLGMCFEYIELYQNNVIIGMYEEVSYNVLFLVLNVFYYLIDSWNFYVNIEGLFGIVQYSQIGKVV